MKKILLSLLIIVLPCALMGQSIVGKLINDKGEPVIFASVILQQPDSTFIDAVITDSLGQFIIQAEQNSYRLILQHIQYETKEIEFTNRDLGAIIMTLKAKELAEVIITAERPHVVVKDGLLRYDVQRIIQNKPISSAYEAILELPGVRELNGKLALAGAPEVSVIINGQPTTMSSDQLVGMLKQMPASSIMTAEVMYSTPPQYHVRGAAININISGIDETAEEGALQGEIRGSYAQHHYGNYNTGASLLYSSKNFAADFMYSYSNMRTRTGLDMTSHHDLQGSIHDIEQENRGSLERQQHTARVGMDFKPNKNSLLSLVYNTSISASGRAIENSIGNLSNSNSVKKFNDQFHNIAFDYSSGFGLKTGINYTYFKSPSSTNFADLNNLGQLFSFNSNAQQKINSFLVYADQSHDLSGNWNLNYGAEFNYANDYDFQHYDNVQGAGLVYDTDNSIKEYIADIYIGAGKNFSERLSLNFSLTGEYYKLADDHNWALLPQAQLTYFQSMKNIMQFSLSSNKQYPSYWEKQNYKGFLNGYAVGWGNPALKPFNTYSAQLTYVRDQKYVFTLYYVYQPNYSAQLGYQDPNSLALIYQTQNWKYNQVMGVNIDIPFNVGKWLTSRFDINGFYHHSRHDNFFDIGFDRGKFIGSINFDNTINLSSKPDLKINLTGHYMTEPMQGIMDISHIWGVDAGVKWSFAKKKAELFFKVTDIFNSSTPDLFIRSNGQNWQMLNLSDTRNFQLSFTYKFGGYKNKERKEIDKSRFGH